MPWQRVELEADCLVVVQAVRSRVSMSSYFGRIVEDCRQLLLDFTSYLVFYIFIRRSANMVDRQFVRVSYLYPGQFFDITSIPSDIKRCIDDDLSYQ